MLIVKPGEYPVDNLCTCDKCGCEFYYYDSEVHTETTTPDEEDFLGGFGVHKYVECPECNDQVTITWTFTEHENWIDNFINRIKKITNKIFRREK